jgi:glycine amidinotransferase
MELFYKLGFNIIPVPFWDVAAFSGGLQCATADIHRDSCIRDFYLDKIHAI